MNEAALLLHELFKTTVEGYNKKVSRSMYSIEFTVEEQHYLLEAWLVERDTSEWEVNFSLVEPGTSRRLGQRNYEITGTGHVFRVLSTVIHLLENFVEELQPRSLTFVAHEPSRVKLYDRLTKTFAVRYQYRLETAYGGNGKLYVLYLA